MLPWLHSLAQHMSSMYSYTFSCWGSETLGVPTRLYHTSRASRAILSFAFQIRVYTEFSSGTVSQDSQSIPSGCAIGTENLSMVEHDPNSKRNITILTDNQATIILRLKIHVPFSRLVGQCTETVNSLGTPPNEWVGIVCVQLATTKSRIYSHYYLKSAAAADFRWRKFPTCATWRGI